MKKIIFMITFFASLANAQAEIEINKKISPIDDSETVTITLTSKDSPSSLLIFRCEENITEGFYTTTKNFHLFMRDSSKIVLTRIGKNKAKSKVWTRSTDMKALFMPNPVKFIKQVLADDTNKLVLRVKGETLIFNTENLNDFMQPLRKSCNW